MNAQNLLKAGLSEPGRFAVTLEYTVPNVADDWREDLEALATFVGEDPRISALALTDRVPSLTTHDTVDLAIRARDASGKMPLVHVSGKNRNINTLRELLQRFMDNGLENALILTGDQPRAALPDATVLCPEGFLDSVQGVALARKTVPELWIGAAVSSFKYSRAAQAMQYMKMQKKLDHGANAIFNQVGLDMRKVQELVLFARANNITVPMIQALYWPTAMLARLALADELPGVVATPAMRDFLESLGSDPDKGKGRRTRILALQIALCRAFGFAGVHIGGIKTPANIKAVLDLADELASQSMDLLWQEWQATWKTADGAPVALAPANGGYVFLGDGRGLNSEVPAAAEAPAGPSVHYRFMKMVHDNLFGQQIEPGRLFWKLYNWADKHAMVSRLLYHVEGACKKPLVGCQGCGSCSLPETAFICTESACAKHLPNGPCGGSKVADDECEVIKGRQCAWVKIYRQAYNAGVLADVAKNFVPAKSLALKNTCSWINAALKRDHRAPPPPAGPQEK